MKRVLLFSIIIYLPLIVFSQKVDNPNKFKLRALPIAFYSPDTKIGFGGAGIATFNFKNDSLYAKKSSVTFGFAYTQLNQVLTYLPYELFLDNSNYWLYGEVGFYKYVFNYFKIGYDKHPDYIEKYDATFPRVRINALRKVYPNLYAGIKYNFDSFNISGYDSEGVLKDGNVTGYNGGTVSGIGTVVNYDTRDLIFFPSKGFLVKANWYFENQNTGSDFEYNKLELDVSKYFTLFKTHTLAVNTTLINSSGDIPFHQMAVLGGTKRLRGYFEGKYRDKDLLIARAEYRFPIYKRFSGVAFGGIGEVAPNFASFNTANIRHNIGAGIRFALDPVNKINIRLDYGFGQMSSGFYLTVGEAF